jgi:arylformamidase
MTKIFDVTVPLSSRLPRFPGDPAFCLEPTHRMADGEPYNVSRLTMGTHSGTHIDAPYHFDPEGATVDALPLDVLVGPASVVKMDAPERIDREDLQDFPLRDTPRVLFKTRSSGQLRGPDFREDFVYLTPEAAVFLAESGVRLVGIDSLSVERYGSRDFAVHHTLLKAGVVIVEGLDLTEVAPGSYEMACLPLRIEGADGAPARVVLRRTS